MRGSTTKTQNTREKRLFDPHKLIPTTPAAGRLEAVRPKYEMAHEFFPALRLTRPVPCLLANDFVRVLVRAQTDEPRMP